MTQNDILNHYFEWLCDSVGGNKVAEPISYRKLLMQLHHTQFYYSIPEDADRAGDGVNLRWRFVCRYNYPREVLDILSGPCSVLELMVAVAVYCEEHVMDDTGYGDRTSQWFWGMVTNLGLGASYDDNYDRRFVEDVVTRFMDRKYDPDGRGGLFRIRNCEHDLRRVRIFYQICWYLNSIT